MFRNRTKSKALGQFIKSDIHVLFVLFILCISTKYNLQRPVWFVALIYLTIRFLIRMSNIFRDSESLGKRNEKKWSNIWTFLFRSGLKSPLILPWSTLLWHRCYYPHWSRDALPPVCGIFLFLCSWDLLVFWRSEYVQVPPWRSVSSPLVEPADLRLISCLANSQLHWPT